MTKVKIIFKHFPEKSYTYLENLVDDYDYGGGFDADEVSIDITENNFVVSFASHKTFEENENSDIEENLLDVLIGRGQFFSSLYFALDDLNIEEEKIRINLAIDQREYSVLLSKDCELKSSSND